MATDIVQSLFGVTPQAYQQAQQDRADAQAMQYARLSPFEQANFAIGRGATGLATALGGALGGQDPQLQMISARQAISKQINYNDPTSIQQGVRMLSEAGDTQGAMMLADVARQAQSEIAQTGQRQAAGVASLAQAGRERTQASPKEVQLAREVASLTGFEEGTPQYNTAYAESLRDQMTKEAKGPGFGTDREAVAAEVYGKTFGNLSQTEKAAVNKRVEEEGGRKAEKGAARLTNVLPGDRALADVPAFRASVQRTIDPQLKTLTATDQALQAINDSLATDNFASFRAAQVQFAKAIAGAGDLSARELKAAGADPSLLGGTADYLSSLATSTPTADTQKKIRSTLQAIRTVAARQASKEVEQQRKIALRSPGYSADAVNEALTFTELLAPAPAPGAVSGDLAAQAAAEIARRAAGKAK
jgi:hypothetical protein